MKGASEGALHGQFVLNPFSKETENNYPQMHQNFPI